jgi:periplasmic protein TonB
MPAPAGVRPQERAIALAAVALVQLALGAALLIGLRVDLTHPADAVQRLIDITLPKAPPPPPPKPPPTQPKPKPHQAEAAPKSASAPLGGSPGPKPAHAPPSVTPIVAVHPTAAPSGGSTGSGPAAGSGAGGGTGGDGYGGDDEGGTDLIQIAGAILQSDYPRDLRERGIGGRVGVLFTVGPNGRVTRCTVTRSSGVAELDSLTCRLIEQRFVYRPSTDRYGRPIADEVEGEHDWVAR